MNFGTKKNRILESFLSHETVSSRILLLFMFFVSINRFQRISSEQYVFFNKKPIILTEPQLS